MSAKMIIDGNAIGNASHHATRLTVGQFETQAIFGYLRTLRDLMEQYPAHDVLNLWDGRAEHRYQVYPGYKAAREESLRDPEKLKKKQAYRNQTPLIEKSLAALGVKQVRVTNLEADDLAGYFSRRFSKAGDNVLLVTGDTDWLQLVDERVTWMDTRGEHGKRIDMANFFESTGYHTPREFLEGKILIGDSSDSIPPVGGIGKETAPEFIAMFRSVEEFWRRCDAGEFVPTRKAHLSLWKGTSPYSKEEYEALLPEGATEAEKKKHMKGYPGQGRILYERNRKLMDLSVCPSVERQNLQVQTGCFDSHKFRIICERLAFMSILRDFNNFIAPFRKRAEQQAAISQAA